MKSEWVDRRNNAFAGAGAIRNPVNGLAINSAPDTDNDKNARRFRHCRGLFEDLTHKCVNLALWARQRAALFGILQGHFAAPKKQTQCCVFYKTLILSAFFPSTNPLRSIGFPAKNVPPFLDFHGEKFVNNSFVIQFYRPPRS